MKAADEGFRFDFEWRITLFTLVMVPTMIGLGIWQLNRAEEKAALGAAWERQQAQPPAPVETLSGLDSSELAYLPAKATGRFRDGKYLLLDNRIYRGRFGYEVLGVLDLEQADMAVLVNRGWFEADAARRSLPEVPVVTGQVTVTGHVYIPPGKPYLLGEQVLEAGWPKVIQAADLLELQPVIGAASLFPHVVRLERGSPGALTVDWKVVNVRPEKHTGYAVQWFTMAAVLTIFFLLRSSNFWQLLKTRRDGGE